MLYYVLTAYAASDPQTGAADAHAILGDAMRVLYEHPVIPDADLEGDLDDAHEQLRVMQVALDSEELGRIWATFDAPYRLSAMYEISVVQLDQSAGTDATVAERVRTIGVPDVRAPFSPPRLVDIQPVTGPPGTNVTVSGEDLAGWTAEVRVSGTEAASGLAITDDTFTFAVPAGLDPGFHQVRIDVSRLARATFAFEVT